LRAIVFDTGPIISLTTNNLLWILEELKSKFNGDFYITKAVKRELVERPLATKRFKFEALQTLKCIEKGVLNVFDSHRLEKETLKLLDMANNSFMARGNYIRLMHYAEMNSIAAYIELGADAFVVDERTTRLMVEDQKKELNILRHKLHTDVKANYRNLRGFKQATKKVKLIRSAELATVAYEMGFLDKYLVRVPSPKKTLIESLLWGVKLSGCSISNREIEEIIRIESKS